MDVWSDKATFRSFVKEINAGLGECIIDLGVSFDYGGGELKLGNIVDIWISDKDTLQDGAVLIYSGYISMYEPFVEGNKEGITVHLLGHHTKLSLDILKNSTTVKLYTDTTDGLTTTASGTAADVGLVMRGIIDRYRAETTNPKLFYSKESIPLASRDMLYVFDQKTYREAMDKVRSIAPTDWFYYVNETGLVYFKVKPTTATHKFIFRRHFTSVRVERSMEKLRNALLFWNGETDASKIYKLYSDTASINQYGRRLEKYYDYGIGNSASADYLGAKFIAEHKEPDIKVICEILDNNGDAINGYNIESIVPGDTCSFYGFDEFLSDVLQENMVITKVTYFLEKVELEVELRKAGAIDWQKKTSDRLDDSQSDGNPVTYS